MIDNNLIGGNTELTDQKPANNLEPCVNSKNSIFEYDQRQQIDDNSQCHPIQGPS